MQNPYAAPNHPYAQQAPPPDAGAGPQQWEPTEVVGRSWSTFGQQAGVLIGSAVVAGLIVLVAQAILGAAFGISAAAPAFEWNSGFDMDKLRRQLEDAQRLSAAALGLTVVIAAVQTFLKAGLIKIHISAARGEQPNFGDLFSGGGRFVPLAALLLIEWVVTLFGPYQMFAGSVLPWEVYVMGSLPVLVVSIWLNLALFQAQYYVVDQGLSPIDAIKRSFKDTQGEKLKLLLFWVLAFLIVLLGVLALCVGIVVALPVVWVAAALIYVRLSGTPGTPQFAGFAPPGWGPPPGGGYGPPPGGGYGPPPGGGYGPPPGGGYGGPPQGGFGGPPQGGFGGPPQGGFGGPPQGGFGGPPQGGFGGPPQGGFGGPPQGGGY